MIKMTAGQWRTALGLAVVAAAIVLSNVMITVRIPSVVEQVGTWNCPNCWAYVSSHAICRNPWQVWPSRLLTQLFRDRLLLVSGVAFGCDPTVDRCLSKSLDACHCDHPCWLRLQCSSYNSLQCLI